MRPSLVSCPRLADRMMAHCGRRKTGLACNEGVHLSIEIDREDDGRWIAEALELPGVMTYGETREEAISTTERLAIEVIADRIRHGELPPSALNVPFWFSVSNWPATKARRVLAALERIGWRVKRQSGSHKLLAREGWSDSAFSRRFRLDTRVETKKSTNCLAGPGA